MNGIPFLAQLVLGAMVVVLIALIGLVIYRQRKKNAPVTPSSIPPIPSSNEANKHFTPTPNVVAASTAKKGLSRKTLIMGAVVFNLLLIVAVVLVAIRIYTPKSKAFLGTSQRLCGTGISANFESLDNGKYTTAFVIKNNNTYAVTVKYNGSMFHCDKTLDPNAQDVSCDSNGQYTTDSIDLAPGESKTITLVGSNPAGACGSFQNDLAITDVIPHDRGVTCNNTNHPLYGINSYTNACTPSTTTPTPTQPPASTPTPGISTPTPTIPTKLTPTAGISTPAPTPTCTPPPTCVLQGIYDIATPPGGWCPVSPTPTPTKPTGTSPTATPPPTSTPTNTPTPVIITATPTPTSSATPTPVIVTATPSPTPIIIAGATATPTPIIVVANNTPAPTTAQDTPLPTVSAIPSAGNPLPAVVVAIPVILMALAFIL